jgi:hypothetical protein
VLDRPSPTLWAVAHGDPPPADNREEEHLVNNVQYALATGQVQLYRSFFRERIGNMWLTALIRLKGEFALRGLGYGQGSEVDA